jgi:hypothetical protein
LTHSDLKGYKVKVERALEGTYRGKKVYTSHAPTSGPAFLHMLNLMEKFGHAGLGEGRTLLNAHRTIEVMKCKSLRPSTSLAFLPGYLCSWICCPVAFMSTSGDIHEQLTQYQDQDR